MDYPSANAQNMQRTEALLATGRETWLGSKSTHIATLVDRKSRYTIILKLKGKDATSVTQALTDKLETLPQALKKSLTWDRGMELAKGFFTLQR